MTLVLKNKKEIVSAFTLIELVVTISIIALTTALVTSGIREESPARALESAGLEFKAFAARVRYRACETGKDWVIEYDPEKRTFFAVPGRFEKFQMPGNNNKNASGSDEVEYEEDEPSPFSLVNASSGEDAAAVSSSGVDDEEETGPGFARLEWKLPQKVQFATPDGSEEALTSGERLEVFRFFPDGGLSGGKNMEFHSGNLANVFLAARLTGQIICIDKEEHEEARNEQ